MIHELREYELHEECWPDYRRLFIDVARRVRADRYGRLLGAWEAKLIGEPEAATSNHVRFVHVWEYESLDHRAELRKQMAKDPGWLLEFVPFASALVHRQFLSVLNPQCSSAAIESLGGKITYLHRARCAVGKATAILAQAENEADVVWSTEFPDPNQVAVLTNVAEIASLAEVRAHIQAHTVHMLTPLDPSNPTLIS